MITTILALIFSISSPAHADVKNELGSCFFNTTNQLMQKMSVFDKKATSSWQSRVMHSRNLECNKSKNQKVRETCQIRGLLTNIEELKNRNPKSTKIIAKNMNHKKPCSYLKLFASKAITK